MKYVLNSEDREFLEAAALMLSKVTKSNAISAAQLISVAKLQHALSRLPKLTSDMTVEVTVTGPRRKYGESQTFHYWDIRLSDGELHLGSGGHFYQPSTGGDSFTSFSWEAAPGGESECNDYRDFHSIVPDLMSYPEGVDSIDFEDGGFRIDIVDSDNRFLEESDDDENGDDDDDDEGKEELLAWPESHKFTITPTDQSEAELAEEIDQSEVLLRDPMFSAGAEYCDFCRRKLADGGLYVDGSVKDGRQWANMCISCFKAKGSGIEWGIGQLYAKQPNDDWRLVLGFPPLDS
jgi:hypothetical protein